MENHDELKTKYKELEQENERLKRINDSFIRQIKERSNAAKGIYPKKQHTGYLLISSQQKEKKYYDGKWKTVFVFETVFKTPYTVDYKYEDVMYMIKNDFLKSDSSNTSIIALLGFSRIIDCKSYSDLFKCEEALSLRKQYEHVYMEQKGKNYLFPEDYTRIKKDYEEDLNKSCFNLNARINGRELCWEMIINHFASIANIPESVRYKIITKKERRKENHYG